MSNDLPQPTIDSELTEILKQYLRDFGEDGPISPLGVARNKLTNLIAQEANKAAVDELEEILTMARSNYEQTGNSDMKALANYCGNRIIQIRETPPAQLTADKEQA